MSTAPVRRSRRPRRPHAAVAALIVAAQVAIAPIPRAAAATTIHRHLGADGTPSFSDAPHVDGELVRRSYRGDYGRPTATASCRGLDAAALARRGARWRASAARAAARHGVDPKLVLAVARVESCFDPRARSVAGALGMMQLMPATAAELGVADPFDPEASLDGGARYLGAMLARFGGDVELALAAYNAGPGNVARHGGVPPFPETRRYVERVGRLYRRSL